MKGTLWRMTWSGIIYRAVTEPFKAVSSASRTRSSSLRSTKDRFPATSMLWRSGARSRTKAQIVGECAERVKAYQYIASARRRIQTTQYLPAYSVPSPEYEGPQNCCSGKASRPGHADRHRDHEQHLSLFADVDIIPTFWRPQQQNFHAAFEGLVLHNKPITPQRGLSATMESFSRLLLHFRGRQYQCVS